MSSAGGKEGTRDSVGAGAVERATAALNRAVYYLDRELAPTQKVRAFQKAAAVIGGLDAADLESQVADNTITDLPGIGRSTGSVITAAVKELPSSYLEDLEAQSACPPTIGAELRDAIRTDLHCHTTWSDGGASVADMVANAVELGHDHLAITDHSPRLTVAHGLSVERLSKQLDEIDELRKEVAPFRILTGMEVDILVDGTIDLPEESLERLDVVVASVHSKLRMDEAEMTRRMVRAVASPHVDILGHCTGRKITGTGRPPSTFDAEIVFAACAQFDTAVEINCRPERRDPPDELIELAKEWNCYFAIDTDAHAPGQMEWQNWGCDKATEHGIAPERIINTWSADLLLDWAGSHPGA
ncbi:MAG: PHP domain-containing protein [Microthrixaceae bacterium]